MNLYLIRVQSEVEIISETEEDATEKVFNMLRDDVSENADVSVISSEIYN